MAITLEEYLRKHEELTLQEQENKINHGKVMDEIEQAHRRHQQEELDNYPDAIKEERLPLCEGSLSDYFLS